MHELPLIWGGSSASRSHSANVDVTRRPDLFIIGAAKSGTTSLYDYLHDHPEIYMSPVKEPAYFSPDVVSPRNSGANRLDLARYLALFAGATDEKRVGEASPHYLYSRKAPGLIHDFQPAARIVAILRNPVDVAYSLHGQRLSNGTETIADFELALAADERPDAGGPNRRRMIDGGGSYRDRARYAQQLQRWFEVFARDRCHLIILEDLTADTATVFRRLLEFLDVDPGYRPDSFQASNRSYRMSGPWRRLITSGPIRWARHQMMPALVGGERAARLGRQLKQRPLIHRPTARSPLDPGLRLRLEDDFAADVARLSELLDRDLSTLWFQRPSGGTAGAAE